MIFEVEIPDWVNWIAQDGDGEWYGYDEEPFSQYVMGRYYWGTAKEMIFLAVDFPPKNAIEELYEIIR